MALDPLNRLDMAEPDRAVVQDRAIAAALNDTERLLSEYAGDPRSFGGRYVNSDLMKERFPDFAAQREGRARYNMAVHNSAAVLSAEQFRRAVADASDGERKDALFLTGVPGAGKSFSVQSRIDGAGVPDDMRVLYEGQLANPAVAIDKVRTALDAGLNVEIIAVLPRVEDAFERTLNRFGENGRGAAIESMAAIHEGLPNGLRALDREFGDKIAIWVHDVRDPLARRELNLQDGLRAWQEELEHGPVRERLGATLDRLREQQRADVDFERQARGQAPFPEHRPLERGGPEGGRTGSAGSPVREGSGQAPLLAGDGVARATPPSHTAETEAIVLIEAVVTARSNDVPLTEPLERALSNVRVMAELGALGLTREDITAFADEKSATLVDALRETANRLGDGSLLVDANSIAPLREPSHAGATAQPAPAATERPERAPSFTIGDVPDTIARRYHTEQSRWRAQRAFYESQIAKDAVFHDRGSKLIASGESPAVIGDMVAIAEHRGWQSITVTGTAEFRRDAWLRAEARGIAVSGYRPNERDMQALDRQRQGNRPRPPSNTATADALARSPGPAQDHPGAERPTRQFLSVPFAEKDAAKAAGARWDGDAKAWYVDAPTPAVARWVLDKEQERSERLIAGDRNARAQLRTLEVVTAKAFPDDPDAARRVLTAGRSALAARIEQGQPIPAPALKPADQPTQTTPKPATLPTRGRSRPGPDIER